MYLNNCIRQYEHYRVLLDKTRRFQPLDTTHSPKDIHQLHASAQHRRKAPFSFSFCRFRGKKKRETESPFCSIAVTIISQRKTTKKERRKGESVVARFALAFFQSSETRRANKEKGHGTRAEGRRYTFIF